MTIKLINGKFEDIDPKVIGKPGLCIIDPPDNIKVKYENYKDNLSSTEYVCLLEKWIVKACEITDGPVFLSFNEKWINNVEIIINKNNIKLNKRIYWHFGFCQNNRYNYSSSIRPIYFLNKNIIYPNNIKIPSDREVKYKDKRAKSGGKMPSNLWSFPRICGNFKERRKWHPCAHPEALIERIVLGHSKSREIVLDPFVGSGVSARVCVKYNRDCIGIDCSEFYLDQIKKELKC